MKPAFDFYSVIATTPQLHHFLRALIDEKAPQKRELFERTGSTDGKKPGPSVNRGPWLSLIFIFQVLRRRSVLVPLQGRYILQVAVVPILQSFLQRE